jgi:hypothetical protein
MREIRAVWALFGAATLAVLVTYARLPPADLYHTSEDGLTGGVGRALVFVNFPTALAAVAILLLCAGRSPRLTALGIALCLVVVIPGVVDQDDLDAKPINALPAAGVAIALAVSLFRASNRLLQGRPERRGDRLRVALAVAIVVLGIPWLFAESGFYAPDPIFADERPEATGSDEETLAAVHLGHHHGTDGVLLTLAALLLSRTLGSLSGRRQALASAYLALMLAYGVANAVQDFWLEQVVKRGWTDHALPSFVRPQLSLGWAAMLAAAALIEVLWFSRERRGASAAR